MMIVLLLCVIMKIAELSVGRDRVRYGTAARSRPPAPTSPTPMRAKRNRPRANYQKRRTDVDECTCTRKKRVGKGAAVMEDPQTPGSDCNSNPATDSIQQDLVGSEFVQDNVEYQWFIDYGYRDGGLHVHPSVLSSLSASYSREDLGYYDDLSRNLDANLAEIDMESFRTADIHTLLTALPVMCTDPVQHSEGEDSACSTTDTISICKSSLLFSPLKETPVLPPGGSYSVDSLDCEDMLLTCQANNKNNYTIAFEGSITMYSDGSQDFENQEKQKTYEAQEAFYNRTVDLKNMPDLSMACSDSKIYTTWSNLKHSSTNKIISRHPSGNNNTIPNFLQGPGNIMRGANKRSQSLPDLRRARELHANVPLNFSVDSAESNHHVQHLQNSGSAMSRSVNEESSDSGENIPTGKKLQNLSLVRLFMKQKSMSTEGMSLTLDQSDSISDNGWPTSNSGSDSASNTNTQQTQRQNVNNACNRQPSNDFSINWLQNDYRNNQEAAEECHKEASSDFPKYSSPIKEDKDEMMSSASVEELSESASRSEGLPDNESRSKRSDAAYDSEHRPRSAWTCSSEVKHATAKATTGVQAIAQTEDNEVQTSLVYPVPAEKQTPSLRETVLNKRPVYVVYPNYTLPDLSFLNIKDAKLDNVALKPQTFDRGKVAWKSSGKAGRPFSCNDIDALKQRGFSHVKDWESLTFLLPTEYKKILHDVPEVSKHINVNEEIKRPLFCLSPPMRPKSRPIGEIVQNNTSSTSSTATQPSSGYRGSSTILTDSSTNQQATSGNASNPLYLYRYDSISSEASLTSNEKRHINRHAGQAKGSSNLPKRSFSLPHGDEPSDCHGRVPPRPPLPRGILRKNKVPGNKRYSMFEMGGVEEVDDQSPESSKRMSLQEPYYMNNDLQLLCRGRIVDSEKDVDETEERYHAERSNETPSNPDLETNGQHSVDDVKQLEEFLKRSGFSSQSSDGDADDADVKLRSYVRKFLALRMNKDITKNVDMLESQKKTVSFAVHQRKKHLDNKISNTTVAPPSEPNKAQPIAGEEKEAAVCETRVLDFDEKKRMISSVNKAADSLLKYWNTESVHGRQGYGDKNECAQLCISSLCPALYAVMSDGLKPHLNSTFGPIANSVWQVVEASSQQGPLTKTLNELVQKINGEDVITEGMLKFHAFVFGLLNLRALDAWFAYLCTRESILRKHYTSNSLFVGALANTTAREIVDALLYILNPLAFCPFRLDLLYQYRQLHNSFGSMNNHAMNPVNFKTVEHASKEYHFDNPEARSAVSSPRKARPRSCVAYYNHDDKAGNAHKADLETAKKRLSNPIAAKVAHHALDKLASEDSEDYTDSLEHSPLNRAARKQTPSAKLAASPDPIVDEEDGISGEMKFRKLQEKWELMVCCKEEAKGQPSATVPPSPTRLPVGAARSKIPRLLASPVKQSNPPLAAARAAKSPVSGIPSLKKPAALTATKPAAKKLAEPARGKDATRRTSRVDQEAGATPRNHLARPSSLPYKSHAVLSKETNLASPHRRAASTSLPRPTAAPASRKAPPRQPVKLTH